jgi:hypothetical protein
MGNTGSRPEANARRQAEILARYLRRRAHREGHRALWTLCRREPNWVVERILDALRDERPRRSYSPFVYRVR